MPTEKWSHDDVLKTHGLRVVLQGIKHPAKRYEFRVRPWEGEAVGTRIDLLIDAMADLFHVERATFRRRTVRDPDLLFAQQVTWYILRERWFLPWELLTAYFDHHRSTFWHGTQNVKDLLDTDPQFRSFVEMLPYWLNIDVYENGETALQAVLLPEGRLGVPEQIKTPPRAGKRAKKGIVGGI